MIQEKKSQAAMEFMVTYGWVILGVMIVTAALAYFGIFDTSKYVNDECSFGTQLYCEDVQIISVGANTDMQINFRNNFGQEIYVGSMMIYYNGVNYDYDGISGGIVASGDVIRLDGTIRNLPLAKNDKVRLKGVIQFNRNVAGAPKHNITGTIVATVK